MKILLSDYSGHPFQVQLSRALAARGHTVCHVFSASFQTPKGRLVVADEDPPGFEIYPVTTAKNFEKHNFFKRRKQEIEIGRKIGVKIAAYRPDIVISSNAPIDTQRYIRQATKACDAAFLFWVQDIYSHAITNVLREKLPLFGALIGRFYAVLEGRELAHADHAILISEDFRGPVEKLAKRPPPMTVIENWAPIDELETHERDNDWATANLKPSAFRAVYTGTLGFKHNPELLLSVAQQIKGDVLVYSEGPAADFLRTEAAKQGLANLKVSGWLPFADLPKALAAADVLLVILEPDAGIYSVPSKTLTYMCAGRAIFGAMPLNNLAAQLIEREQMGQVVPSTANAEFGAAVARLEAHPEAAKAMGAAARDYAERTFRIETICDRFDSIFNTVNKTSE